MLKNMPNFDPYAVLSVDKQASAAEIKTAYRKLVLKCHPDKIQDETLRAKAVDEFQKLQESYEILSDDNRRRLYDQEVYLAALRSEIFAQKAAAADSYSSTRGTSTREYRDGRIYEERAPADAQFFTDSEERLYAEEPSSYSHKYHDNTKRPHTKVAEEKKKAKPTPVSTPNPKATRQSDRDSVKVGYHDREKVRTKERRRDVSDKYERTTAAYVVSDSGTGPDSDSEPVHYTPPRESARRKKSDPVSGYAFRHHRAQSVSSSGSHSYDSEDDFVHQTHAKLDDQQAFLKEYISRKKDPIIEIDRRPRSARHAKYEDRDPHYSERPKHSSRSSRHHSYVVKEAIHVTEIPSSRSSRRSHERLHSPGRVYEHEREPRDREPREWTVPSMPTASSQQASSSPRATPSFIRAVTSPYPRERRSESKGPFMSSLFNMAGGSSEKKHSPRISRPRGAERNDSGYSSGPSTPEMPQGSSGSSTKSTRYKVVETPDGGETVVKETIDTHYRASSPRPPARSDRARDRSTASRPATKSSRTTYTYPQPEVITIRPAAVSSKSSPPASRQLYGEIRHSPEIVFDGRRYHRQSVH